jgi:DNA polymerase-1
MRLPILEYEGYEADDVIGTFARQAADRGLEVVIVTSDKDMLQLVRTGDGAGPGTIRVLIPTKNDLLVDERKVEELLGVPPEKVADVMALMGDSIDNIPGAKGIGEKGARELIRRFGSAEAALEHAAEVESKRYRNALENSREAVLLSKQLAQIATNVPLTLELEKLKLLPPDIEALRALYAELGFASLLRELAPVPANDSGKASYQKASSAEELERLLAAIPPGREAALWLTLDLAEGEEEGFGSRLAAIEISTEPGSAATAWLDKEDGMRVALRKWLADSARPKIVHDPKLAELLLGPVAGIRHATMLYSYLLRPTTAKHRLGDVVLRQFNVTLSGTPGEHADYLMRLAPLLRAEVESRGLQDVYERIDLPLAPVLARMERTGVRVDREALRELSARMEAELTRLEKKVFALAGQEFNINSPQQLAEILYDKLNLPAPRRTRTKGRSTAAGVLEELAAKHPLPRAVIEYREVAKLKSTYVDALPRLIHPETGRLHTRFSQTGTATGRLSSSNPNLQNIPVRSELGREIRAAFTAEPGWVLLSADYSQIELRLLAHFSQDPVLLEAFRKGEDIHARTAAEVFGVAPGLQTAEHRRIAKVINFGIIYGLSAFGLAQQLGLEPSEAKKFIAAYFERYQGVKRWLDAQLEHVRQTQETRTLFGRIRPIPEINAQQGVLRGFAERTALNTPLQGTAADLIKLAMIAIDRQLQEGNFRARMILQVHDELLFEAPEDELNRLRALVKPVMEQVESFSGPLAVPLVVELKAGRNWRDLE